MGTILIILGVIAAVALLFPWSWAGTKLGWSTQTTATAAKASALLDEAAFLLSLMPASLLAMKRGDGKIKELFGQCRAQAATWDDVVPAPTVTVSTTTTNPTVAQLTAEIESLKSQLDSLSRTWALRGPNPTA